MSVIDTLITDRSGANVEALEALSAVKWEDMTAAQRASWEANLKGSYRASDFNRVGEACGFLYETFTALGYAVPGYVPLGTGWTESGVPTAGDMDTYLGTVAALKAVLGAIQAIPESMERLGVEDANNIERLLAEVDDQIRRMEQSFVYSGMVYSGQLWGGG